MNSCAIRGAAREGLNALRIALSSIGRALRRLNSVGLGGLDGATPRALRARAFRNSLGEKYRGSSPCC
jgi:hypothetical protein